MKISITDCDQGFVDLERKVIESVGHELSVYQCLKPSEVIKIAKDSDAIICQYATINREVLKSMDRCKVVGRYGVGLDNIDVKSATEFGIKVVYVPYFCFQEVANHTMGLILALSRNIVRINDRLRSSSKDSQIDYGEMLRFMDNVERPTEQTIGIIGLGKIGKQVAKRARGFGYNLVACDPYLPSEIISSWEAKKVGLKELLKTSDFVTIHCPLNEETQGMIGERELGLMKKTAYIINTARGKIIDEKSLINALKTDQIKGAALDVLEKEPIPKDSELLQLDNVILTPHVAFYSKTSLYELKTKVAKYTVNALKGKGEYYLANPEVVEG
ncbi:MAG: C-terminal binding protein [bacterium]